jgi:hypothetical protein
MSAIYERQCKCPEIPCPFHPTPNRPFTEPPKDRVIGIDWADGIETTVIGHWEGDVLFIDEVRGRKNQKTF